jgi:hypothetical protein
MIERLWRSLTYECVYLNAFETGSEPRRGDRRLDQLLHRKTSALIAWVADAS